jgi:hypothetical protein
MKHRFARAKRSMPRTPHGLAIRGRSWCEVAFEELSLAHNASVGECRSRGVLVAAPRIRTRRTKALRWGAIGRNS